MKIIRKLLCKIGIHKYEKGFKCITWSTPFTIVSNHTETVLKCRYCGKELL